MSVAVKEAVCERDGFCCTECGMTSEESVERWGRDLEVHRLIPGGLYLIEECITLCRSCHGPKPKSPTEKNLENLVTIRATISVDVAYALSAFLKQTGRGLAEEVTLALENHLVRHGLWPPKDKAGR